MMDEPGSFSGSKVRPNRNAAEASQRMSFEIFMSEAASVSSAPLGKDNLIVRRSAANLFGWERKGSPVSSAIFLAARSQIRHGVQPRPHGRSADSQIVQPVEHLLQTFDMRSSRLAQPPNSCRWSGVRHLAVCAPNLDHVIELFCFGRNRIMNGVLIAESVLFLPSPRPHVHRRQERIVDDCDILTSSLGWIGFFDPISPPASSIARLEMTSLTFMLVCVPLPVCRSAKGTDR